MMMISRPGRVVIGRICLAAAAVLAVGQMAAADTPGQPAAAAAAQRRAAALAAATQLEADSQAALTGQPSSEASGRVCVAIVDAYVKCGAQGLNKVAQYCQMALACPQDVLTQVRLLAQWGNALVEQPASGVEAAAGNRQLAVGKYLAALNVVLANQTATRPQAIPKAGPSRQAVLLQNNLVSWREALIECMAEAYRGVPAGRTELQGLATAAVASSGVVQEILVRYDRM